MKQLLRNVWKIFRKKKDHDGVRYKCPQCHIEEIIPQDAIHYVNAIDPERCLIGPPSFRCERCGHPYMMPKGWYEE